MPAAKAASTVPIYQLKVTLQDSKPPIWRRILVRSDLSLYKLHQILQLVMDWTDSHLHQFIVGDQWGATYYGVPDRESAAWGMDIKSERTAKLNRIAPAVGSKFVYEYDFGDDWRHVILVEKILPPEPGVRYPTCIKGKRACPPEDCGGIWGYDDFLAALKDPAHPEHDDLVEWVGGEFDPEAFDLDEINTMLELVR